MRQPRRTDRYRPANLANASLPSWLDEETGRLDELEDPNMVELEPINIQGDPNAPEVVELAPFDIAGDVDAPPRRVGDYAPAPSGTRAPEEPKPMDGDWLDLVSTVLPEAVEDERTGLGGVEIPEWATRVIANDDGTMPTGALEAIGNLVGGSRSGSAAVDIPAALARVGSMGSPITSLASGAASNASRDMRIAPEDRTVLAAPAVAGLANAGSLGFADDIAGLLPEEVTSSAGISSSGDTLRDQMRGGFDWAQREAPGSVAIGEDAAILAQMAVPGAPLRAGASPTARALATGAEGALMGGLEGFGRSDAETVGGRLRDAVPSAVAGGVLSGGLGALAGRERRIADSPVDADEITRRRENAAMDWLGHVVGGRDQASQNLLASGATPDTMPSEALRMLGRMRERGIVPPDEGGLVSRLRSIPDVDDMASGGREARRQGDAAIQEVAEAMGDRPLSTEGLAGRFRSRADALQDVPVKSGERARWEELAEQHSYPRPEDIDRHATWDTFQTWKNEFGDPGDYGADQGNLFGRAYRDTRDEMQSLVDRELPGLADSYRQGRDDSQLGRVLGTVDARRRSRDARNRIGGLTNTMAVLAGGGTVANVLADGAASGSALGVGTLAGAMALGRANQFARSNEHAIRAVSTEASVRRLIARPEIAQRWASVLTEAQRRGPRAIAAALYLIQQRDPQARQAMQADEEQPETQDMPEMQLEQPAPIEDVENVPIDDLWAEEPITDVENVPIEELWQ